MPNFGALVISLDLEMLWGVRDFLTSRPDYEANISGEKKATEAILSLFEEFEIAATWATVGLLFADSASMATAFEPKVLPNYSDPTLSPYSELNATNGRERLQFAPDLIERIKNTARQEVATHTFSHYYCLEPGQSSEAFAADIDSARAIAELKSVRLKSIVFPRNQHNPTYDSILASRGIRCFRGNQPSRMYQFDRATLDSPFYRSLRFADTYFGISGHNAIGWNELQEGELVNIRASIFLRPINDPTGWRERMQFKRISRAMEYAARNRQIFHLWWHPHNFGTKLDANLAFLRQILDRFKELKEGYGMRSLSMSDVVNIVADDAGA